MTETVVLVTQLTVHVRKAYSMLLVYHRTALQNQSLTTCHMSVKFVNITQQTRGINQPHGYTSVIAAAFNYVTLLCTHIPLIFVHGYKDIPCN